MTSPGHKNKFNRIKAVLALKGIKNKDFAAMLHKKPQTTSAWCTNSRQPRLDELFAIAKVLNVQPVELLEPFTDIQLTDQST